jgi:hypothetical protein
MKGTLCWKGLWGYRTDVGQKGQGCRRWRPGDCSSRIVEGVQDGSVLWDSCSWREFKDTGHSAYIQSLCWIRYRSRKQHPLYQRRRGIPLRQVHPGGMSLRLQHVATLTNIFSSHLITRTWRPASPNRTSDQHLPMPTVCSHHPLPRPRRPRPVSRSRSLRVCRLLSTSRLGMRGVCRVAWRKHEGK